MAKTTPLLLLLLVILYTAQASAMIARRVGGRSQLKNVKENKEVQDLGRYCVQEYNHQLQHTANGSTSTAKLLVFSEVVEAETQVVSGIKYYLKIAAAGGGGGAPRTYEAVVVVKPWLHSKELLNFAPSLPPRDTK